MEGGLFTGIVQGTARVERVEDRPGFRRLWLRFPPGATDGLVRGASVAVGGTCLTAVDLAGDEVGFDCIDETLRLTRLGDLGVGHAVNYERSARLNDEIGGHLLSGHVRTTVRVVDRVDSADNRALTLQTDPETLRYVLPKGYVALDGCSLTVGVVDRDRATFSVHLIPETLSVTTLGALEVGDRLNLEVDAMTQAVVDTVERVLASQR